MSEVNTGALPREAYGTAVETETKTNNIVAVIDLAKADNSPINVAASNILTNLFFDLPVPGDGQRTVDFTYAMSIGIANVNGMELSTNERDFLNAVQQMKVAFKSEEGKGYVVGYLPFMTFVLEQMLRTEILESGENSLLSYVGSLVHRRDSQNTTCVNAEGNKPFDLVLREWFTNQVRYGDQVNSFEALGFSNLFSEYQAFLERHKAQRRNRLLMGGVGAVVASTLMMSAFDDNHSSAISPEEVNSGVFELMADNVETITGNILPIILDKDNPNPRAMDVQMTYRTLDDPKTTYLWGEDEEKVIYPVTAVEDNGDKRNNTTNIYELPTNVSQVSPEEMKSGTFSKFFYIRDSQGNVQSHFHLFVDNKDQYKPFERGVYMDVSQPGTFVYRYDPEKFNDTVYMDLVTKIGEPAFQYISKEIINGIDPIDFYLRTSGLLIEPQYGNTAEVEVVCQKVDPEGRVISEEKYLIKDGGVYREGNEVPRRALILSNLGIPQENGKYNGMVVTINVIEPQEKGKIYIGLGGGLTYEQFMQMLESGEELDDYAYTNYIPEGGKY